MMNTCKHLRIHTQICAQNLKSAFEANNNNKMNKQKKNRRKNRKKCNKRDV